MEDDYTHVLATHLGYTIAGVPGMVFVYGNDIAQAFKVTDVDPKFWQGNPAAIRAAALHYTEGHTNKERFKFSVTGLLNNGKITGREQQVLLEIIHNCNCRPAAIQKKIEQVGMAKLIPLIDFIDHDPRLEASVEVLSKHLKRLKELEDRGTN